MPHGLPPDVLRHLFNPIADNEATILMSLLIAVLRRNPVNTTTILLSEILEAQDFAIFQQGDPNNGTARVSVLSHRELALLDIPAERGSSNPALPAERDRISKYIEQRTERAKAACNNTLSQS